jgi:hypothetical protein
MFLAGLCVRSPNTASAEPSFGPNASIELPARPTGIRAVDLPLRFEPNRGQWDAQVRYLARGPGFGLFFSSDGVTIALLQSGNGSRSRHEHHRRAERDVVEAARLKLSIVGARVVEPVGLDRLAGESNHLVGNDPSKWRSGLEGYTRVSYPNVLPGVDVAYYGTGQRRLEYDLIVAPRVDPSSVAIRFEGVLSIDLEPDGSALLHLPDGGELRQAPPTAYQLDASGARVTVPSGYQKRSDDTLGFSLSNYDRSRQLVIDPLVMSAHLSGTAKDFATGVAVDSHGNTFLVGTTASSDFPTASAAQGTSGGSFDAFVTKLNPSGAVVYSTYLGGSGVDFGVSVAVDGSGSAYVVGNTGSSDFPTVSPIQAAPGSQDLVLDLFVSKLSPAGSTLLYSTYLGGSGNDRAVGIAVDGQGAAYVAGETASTDFPTTASFQPSYRGGDTDGFAAKLNAAGSALAYSTYLGGAAQDAAGGIAVDALGNAYIVGSTGSLDFPLVSPLQGLLHGTSDAFVGKLNPAGTALAYSTYLGGNGDDFGNGVAVDSAGNVYVAGETQSSDFPTVASWQASHAPGGASDAFVSKLNAGGSALLYSTYLGGTGDDTADSVAVDIAGRANVGGTTDSTDFPLIEPLTTDQNGGFVSRLSASGSALTYSSYLTPVSAVALDSTSNIYVASYTHSSAASTDAYVLAVENPSTSPMVPASHTWTIALLAGLVLVAGRRRLQVA